MSEHIDLIPAVTRERLAASYPVACIDGRRDAPSVGVPGGSSGMFVLLVDTWEELRHSPLDKSSFDSLLTRYLDRFGSLYLHTDESAASHLLEPLLDNHVVEPSVPVMHRLLREPPADRHAGLLERLGQQASIGCGHLKAIHTDPVVYGTRRGIVLDFLRAFFRRLWSGDSRLEIEVLTGCHDERAVLHLVSVRAATTYTQPARPRVGAGQETTSAFIHHPQVADWILREQANMLADLAGRDRASASSLFVRQKSRYSRWLNATSERLAASLPHFTAEYTGAASNPVVIHRGPPSHSFYHKK